MDKQDLNWYVQLRISDMKTASPLIPSPLTAGMLADQLTLEITKQTSQIKLQKPTAAVHTII